MSDETYRQRAHYERQNELERQFDRRFAKNPIPAKPTGICPICGRPPTQPKSVSPEAMEWLDRQRRRLVNGCATDYDEDIYLIDELLHALRPNTETK